MATAAGWAAIPINLSFKDALAGLTAELNGPVAKAAKAAGDSLEAGIGQGAEAAAQRVEKAQYRVKRSTQELTDAESKYRQEKLKQEAADKALEAAAERVAAARVEGGDKAAKAEEQYLKAQARSEAAANATRKASEKLKDAQEESARAAKRLADAEEEAASGTDNLATKSKGASGEVSDLGSTLESAGGKLKDFADLAAGFAGIASIGSFVSNGWEFSNSLTDIQNELGLSSEAAQTFGDDIKTVMGSGVASSMDEASSAISDLNSQFDYLGSEGEQTAADLSDNFIGFSKTFGVEMSEATQTAGQLVTNGLAGDVEQAADLMTAAMQRVPAQMRGELPEIINEYGTNFRALGFDGEEAFSMLVNAADKGKWALDKTGDALKEFTIRGSDMSTTSVAAYESIGLNAEEMSRKVAAGGDEARGALEETAQKLLGIEDPAQRANTAIALFGTPLEDLSVDQIPQFLDSLTGAEDSMQGFEGSSQAVADNIANSLQGRLDSLKGTVSGLAGDAFMWVWDVVENDVIPAFKEFGGWVQDNEGWLGPLAAAIGAAAGAWALWTGAIKTWQVATKIATGIQVAFNAVMAANPIMLAAMAIAALAAGLVYFFTQTETGKAAWENLTNALSAGWEWVKTTVFDAWTATTEAFSAGWTATTDAVTGAWTWVKDTFTETWNSLKAGVFDVWTTTVDAIKAGWDVVTGALGGAWTWLKDTFVGAWELIKTLVFDAFMFYVDLVKNGFQVGVDAIGAGWNWMKDALSNGWNWIRDNVFSAFNSAVDLMKSGAETAMNGIGTAFDWLREKTATPINFVIETVYNNGLKKAWDGVAGLVGLDPLPEMHKVAFASGGIMPGYTPGKDVHRFYSPTAGVLELSGGEPVLRPEAGKVLGRSWVDGINASAIRGGVNGVKNFLGAYANGGVIDSITGIVAEKFPWMTITSTYRPGDSGHHGTGNAVDFSDGTDSTPGMRAAAQYFADNYGAGLLELIHSPFNNNIKNGQSVGDGFGFYGAGTMNAHRNHVHVAAGSPLAGGGSGGVLGVLSGAVNFVGDQVKKLWDGVINAIPKFEGAGQIAKLPGAFLTKVGGAAWDWISEKVSSIGAFFGDPGAGVEQWRGLVESVLTAKGFSTGLADTVLRRMNQESGGNPAAINGWDSNAAAGTPSKGLMQVIDPTFQSYKDPGFDDIWDPESNIRASMNYAVATYGSLPAAYNKEGGYHLGGLAPAGQGLLHKTAMEPEMVLSPSMTEAFISWMNGTSQGESAAVVAKELSEAFRGGDWGYGELARVLGNEQVAQAIVNGAAALGEFNRTMAPVVADSAQEYATSEAKSALSYVGLDPLVDLGVGLADKAWAAYQENPVSLGVTGDGVFAQSSAGRIDASIGAGGVKIVIEAESNEDLVRVAQVKELASRIQGLEVELRAPQRPVAAATTRGGVI